MEYLLTCDGCRHSAIAHDSLGCELTGCRCRSTRGHIVDLGIAAAREEIRSMWERVDVVKPGSGEDQAS